MNPLRKYIERFHLFWGDCDHYGRRNILLLMYISLCLTYVLKIYCSDEIQNGVIH